MRVRARAYLGVMYGYTETMLNIRKMALRLRAQNMLQVDLVSLRKRGWGVRGARGAQEGPSLPKRACATYIAIMYNHVTVADYSAVSRSYCTKAAA